MRGEGPEGARIDEGAAAVLACLERQPVVRAAPHAIKPDESPIPKLVNVDRSCDEPLGVSRAAQAMEAEGRAGCHTIAFEQIVCQSAHIEEHAAHVEGLGVDGDDQHVSIEQPHGDI